MNKILQKKIKQLLVFIIIIYAGSFAGAAFAQATFTTECPQKTIGKNDLLQVAFKLANASNVESINPPSFKNFVVVSGPNQESGMTSINGKTDQYVSISYVLKPVATGTFSIGAATAKADGKELSSKAIAVSVTNASSSSSNNSANSFSPFSGLNFNVSPQPASQRFDDYILKKGDNVSEKVKKNLFIKLDATKTMLEVADVVDAL